MIRGHGVGGKCVATFFYTRRCPEHSLPVADSRHIAPRCLQNSLAHAALFRAQVVSIDPDSVYVVQRRQQRCRRHDDAAACRRAARALQRAAE